MPRIPGAIALVCAAALAAEAGDPERYSIVRKLDDHETLQAEEDLQTTYTTSSLDSKPQTYEISWGAEYKDRPPKDPRDLRQRTYSRSESTTRYTDDLGVDRDMDSKVPELSGKTLAMSTPKYGTEEYEKLAPEQKRARAFDTFIDLLLPTKLVKVNESWKIDPQLFPAFFFYTKSLSILLERGPFRGTSEGRLVEIAEQGGRRIAVISIRVKGHYYSKFLYTRTKSACAIKGTLRWDLTHDLPVELKVKVEAGGRTVGRTKEYKRNGQPYAGHAIRRDQRVSCALFYQATLLRDDAAAKKAKAEQAKKEAEEKAGDKENEDRRG